MNPKLPGDLSEAEDMVFDSLKEAIQNQYGSRLSISLLFEGF